MFSPTVVVQLSKDFIGRSFAECESDLRESLTNLGFSKVRVERPDQDRTTRVHSPFGRSGKTFIQRVKFDEDPEVVRVLLDEDEKVLSVKQG